MSRTPDPKTWTSAKLSQGNVADYKPFTMVDGEGVRCSLYVSGCPFACVGCFNEAAWSFQYGTKFTQELGEQIAQDLRHESVQGLSLLGGEPFVNTGTILPVVHALRAEHANTKDIWCWTGYTFEELLTETATGAADKAELLALIDVLVDGRFELAKKDLSLAFRGSSNQRVIDVPQSLNAGHAVLWAGLDRRAQAAEQVDRRAMV